jgi:clan AA aspartic protease (TIGR02281 family)
MKGVAMKGVAMALTFAGLVSSNWAADSLPTIDEIYLAEQAGRADEAQRMIAQVVAARPNSAKAHYVQAEVYARAGKLALARSELARAEQLEPSMAFAKPRAIAELRAQLAARSGPGSATKLPEIAASSHSKEDRVLLASSGGVLVAPVIVNNAIKLNFLVDSGASDVSIPSDVFASLLRSGAITQADITGSRKFVDANGDTSRAKVFVIRSLKVGTVEVKGVEADVAPVNAPLLLGQSFLRRFKSWSIDNATQELLLQR